MAKSDFESRRRFLKSLVVALGCQQFGAEVLAAQAKKSEPSKAPSAPDKAAPATRSYKVGPWVGDDYTMGHKLRGGEFPKFPDKAEKQVDFVIVGGGVAGLTAAYELKDHDFLLLEQYGETGGNSRGSSYHGIDYSYGAAYVGPIDGIYGQLYSDLGLDPITLPPERNEFYFNGQWYVSAQGDTSKPIYAEFNKLLEEAKPIWKNIPLDPDPAKMSTGDLQKLDATPFAPVLQAYSKDFRAVLDSFCRSSFGGGLDQLSALAGYSIIQDLVIPTHVFKGGNPAIARGLANRINTAGSQRCLKNAFVWRIEIKENGASVIYSLADGSVHKVDCKHVVVATPPLVSSRQMVHIPDQLKAYLFNFKYCSYLVANVLMKEKLFKGKYDCFVGQPYSFADITVAETPYMMTNSYKPEMGSVLTIYQPYPNGAEGRALLLMADREKFADSFVQQMGKLVPDFSKGVDEVILSRWGHAFAIVGPNYFANLAKIHAAQTHDHYTLAHSTIFGWPAAESAIRAGVTAADRAKKLAANPGMIVQ